MTYRVDVQIRRSDVLIAVVALCGIVAGTYGRLSYTGSQERELDTTGLALILIASVALAWRRTAPVPTGIVTTGAAIAYYLGHYPGVFAAAPALVSIYTAATLGRRRVAIALAATLAVVAYGMVALSDIDPAAGDGINVLSGWLAAMVIAGEVTRNRRAYLREVERRADEAERTKEEAALRRAGEERLWIAQELHDTLTHTISVMNVQATVALQLLNDDPGRAGAAMTAVKEAGGEAMHELRSTLGALHSDPDVPDAGLARLPRLVARVEGAGHPVASAVVGEPYPLPADIDAAAYRILQEAFTNVLRHAGAASVDLVTEYRQDTFAIRVDDDGEGAAADAPGSQGMGLIGMRERALAVGGTLEAGPRPGGGFRVCAELPVVSRA